MGTELLAAMDRAGVRVTEPRRRAATIIAAQQGHFTAADLIGTARRARLRLGRATIFRLLETLAAEGVVEQIGRAHV